MGWPKGKKRVKETVAGPSPLEDAIRFNPSIDDTRAVAQEVLSSLIQSRDARRQLFDDGYALIDLCYQSLSIKARHHRQLYELDEQDLDGLSMQDFDALGMGFKYAKLSDILALPGTRKI